MVRPIIVGSLRSGMGLPKPDVARVYNREAILPKNQRRVSQLPRSSQVLCAHLACGLDSIGALVHLTEGIRTYCADFILAGGVNLVSECQQLVGILYRIRIILKLVVGSKQVIVQIRK